VWKSEKDEIALYPTELVAFVIPRTQQNLLRWEIHTETDVEAPIAINQALGDVVFTLSNEPKKTITLVSMEDVDRAGWFKRAWQTLLKIHRVDWRWFAGIAGGISLLIVVFIFVSNRSHAFKRSR
jgi:D-alanyl-D-alanine carboxypeptidase